MLGGPHKASTIACPLQGEQRGLGHRSANSKAQGYWAGRRGHTADTRPLILCSLRILFWLKWEKFSIFSNKASTAQLLSSCLCKATMSSPEPRAVGQNLDPKEGSWP